MKNCKPNSYNIFLLKILALIKRMIVERVTEGLIHAQTQRGSSTI